MRASREGMGRIGLQMLARMTKAERDAVKAEQAAVMLDGDLATRGERRRRIPPRVERIGDFAEQPGTAERRATDMTPSAPERRSASFASSGEAMSPLTMTGICRAAFTAPTAVQSARPS